MTGKEGPIHVWVLVYFQAVSQSSFIDLILFRQSGQNINSWILAKNYNWFKCMLFVRDPKAWVYNREKQNKEYTKCIHHLQNTEFRTVLCTEQFHFMLIKIHPEDTFEVTNTFCIVESGGGLILCWADASEIKNCNHGDWTGISHLPLEWISFLMLISPFQNIFFAHWQKLMWDVVKTGKKSHTHTHTPTKIEIFFPNSTVRPGFFSLEAPSLSLFSHWFCKITWDQPIVDFKVAFRCGE